MKRFVHITGLWWHSLSWRKSKVRIFWKSCYLSGKMSTLGFQAERSAFIYKTSVFIFSLESLRQHSRQNNVDYLQGTNKMRGVIIISCNLKLLVRRVNEWLRILMSRQSLVVKKTGYGLNPAVGDALFSGHRGLSPWGK